MSLSRRSLPGRRSRKNIWKTSLRCWCRTAFWRACGGYRLTRSPDQYTVGEILMLTEGSLAPVSCLTPNATPCSRMANCRTYEMWKGLNDLISNYFGNITLADLARPDQAGNDYVI